MKKRILCLLSLLLIVSLAMPVWAANPGRVVDQDDLLSAHEEDYLRNRLDEISDQYNLDVVVVTVTGLDGRTAQSCADDFYDYNGYRPDGILLLISLSERYWAISTTGYGITAFTDAGLAWMEEQFIDSLSDGDYAGAFNTFASCAEQMLIQAGTGAPYDVGNLPKEPFEAVPMFMLSVIVGLASAFIVTMVLKGQLKSVRSQAAASEYVARDSFQLTRSADIYLYRNVTRTKRQTSSGGSSTHRGSSGVSHGGRSGRF